ncbi:hypothetical protein COD67_01860 [Bacillus cereus]|nr:hypothetical protein COI89_06525 [Bacillus cereus]PGU70834.1 hypothetical protein COD67_01860 [Bacillus cereus]
MNKKDIFFLLTCLLFVASVTYIICNKREQVPPILVWDEQEYYVTNEPAKAEEVGQRLGEVMPMAFASAFSEDKEQSEKTMTSAVIKHLSDKDATMATREVTLNLKKDKDDDYKIVSDNNLKEVLFANVKSLERMFGRK